MTHDIWQKVQRNGWASVQQHVPTDASEAFYLCVLAYHHQAVEIAHRLAGSALQFDRANRLFQEMVTFLTALQNGQRHDAYVEPAGFEAFIRGGGNVPLYENVSSRLGQVYVGYTNLLLLDIGTGDGYALLPALTSQVAHIDVIEPSTAMVNKLANALDACSQTYTSHNQTVQAFMEETDASQHWKMVQSTFALQSLPVTERHGVLAWLRTHTSRLLIAEFDVPQFADTLAPQYAAYVMDRFERGLAEYAVDSPVAQGFLMPVMFGYFDSTAARVNYEQPAAHWERELRQAGFTHVTRSHVYDYWWAPAFLLDAT